MNLKTLFLQRILLAELVLEVALSITIMMVLRSILASSIPLQQCLSECASSRMLDGRRRNAWSIRKGQDYEETGKRLLERMLAC